MKTNYNGSVVGQFVKFTTKKIYAPNAGEQVAYGYVTDYIRHGCYGVVYAFEDGEYASEMVHSSRLEVCHTDELIKAVDSALLWADSENKDLLERMTYYAENGDQMSVDNLKLKSLYIGEIYFNPTVIELKSELS